MYGFPYPHIVFDDDGNNDSYNYKCLSAMVIVIITEAMLVIMTLILQTATGTIMMINFLFIIILKK